MVWSNTVSSPASLRASIDFKESWKAYISLLHREWPAVKFTQAFLAGYTSLHERYDIDIYTQKTTKLFTPIIKFFVALKVLIQNERIRWFTVQTLRSEFVQGIVRVGYSPLFFYYELLVILSIMLPGVVWPDLSSAQSIIAFSIGTCSVRSGPVWDSSQAKIILTSNLSHRNLRTKINSICIASYVLVSHYRSSVHG